MHDTPLEPIRNISVSSPFLFSLFEAARAFMFSDNAFACDSSLPASLHMLIWSSVSLPSILCSTPSAIKSSQSLFLPSVPLRRYIVTTYSQLGGQSRRYFWQTCSAVSANMTVLASSSPVCRVLTCHDPTFCGMRGLRSFVSAGLAQVRGAHQTVLQG